jgi:hypothetical protein
MTGRRSRATRPSSTGTRRGRTVEDVGHQLSAAHRALVRALVADVAVIDAGVRRRENATWSCSQSCIGTHWKIPITPTIRPSHQWFQRIFVKYFQHSARRTAVAITLAT